MKKILLLSLAFLCFFQHGCQKQKSVTVTDETNYPKPPVAAVKPDTLKEFGNVRVDNYFWLKDRNNPDVMAYLKAENAYFDTVMSHTKDLQKKLYIEMRGRIKEDDQTVPYLDNGYYYYSRTEKDKQYRVYCRKKGDLQAPEENLFDVNKMAEGSNAYLFATFEVSRNNDVAGYMFNTTGSYADFKLKFRDLKTGADFPDEIDKVQSFVLANDNKTVFYAVGNESLRPYRVYRHVLNSKVPDKLIYEEKDDMFNLGLGISKTKEYIYMVSSSFTSSEYRYIPADKPEGDFKLFMARKPDVEYFMEHHKNGIFIRYKDKQSPNRKIFEAPLGSDGDMTKWKEIIPHDPAVKIQDMELFEKYIALFIRKDGLDGISIYDLNTKQNKAINFPEPVYALNPDYTPEFTATKCRYNYSSLNRPLTTYDYDMATGSSEKLKEQEIPSGFNPDAYVVERLWAVSSDSTKVPMAIVYKKDMKKDGNNPALLYGYGSYGYSTDANFRSGIFSLVDRGFIFAIGQIRGGSEMGEQWYENGKLMNKKNSFNDFIACAEKLIQDKYTQPSKLAINGGSAGGLLVGAVTVMRPDLFKAVIADVPFVDVVSTMLDESLPLTTQEYEQWGNPHNEPDYKYMLSYSPYDNIKKQEYPNILATAGWNDSQVLYHEPAKFVAKIRAMKTGNNIVLLKTNLESGHGGATGRFDYLKEVAFKYAFLIDRLGIAE
jgi:oligopeptidase B